MFGLESQRVLSRGLLGSRLQFTAENKILRTYDTQLDVTPIRVLSTGSFIQSLCRVSLAPARLTMRLDLLAPR
jgi:hypothetical protein